VSDMGSHGAFQDAVLPSSLDDYSAVKSKWVVMQHSKNNKNNLHDLASVYATLPLRPPPPPPSVDAPRSALATPSLPPFLPSNHSLPSSCGCFQPALSGLC